jgi:hypothetical protein
MSEAAKKLAKPNASADITGLVEELILNQAYTGSLPVSAPVAVNAKS